MKLSTKFLIITTLLLVMVACKDTKKEEEENATAKATIEKVEVVESELETITKDLEKQAEVLDNTLNALDDI